MTEVQSPKSKPLNRPLTSFSEAQSRATAAGSRLELPCFETDPKSLKDSMDETIRNANQRLDAIADLSRDSLTFENTIRELDDLLHPANLTANRTYLIKETHPHAAMRDQATELIKEFQGWAVGLDYREDVYRTIRAYADTKPKLEGEDQRLFDDTLRDYRRAGLELPPAERAEVEKLRKKLSLIATDFDTNITQATATLEFTREDLEGLPQDFLDQEDLRNENRNYELQANITWHFVTVMENAKSEATRKRMKVARYSLAADKNIGLFNEILRLRTLIANKLGYRSWADYKTETKMAGNGATAIQFLKDLNEALTAKFEAELESFRAIKAAETGVANATINIWDWRYYANQLKKQRCAVNTEQLRSYFPYERALDGMFRIYERIFELSFLELEAPYKWTDDLQLFLASDAKTGEPLGTFYLDMFPRKGKFNHFAQFGLIDGKRLPSGEYQRACVALICNFPTPPDDKPSLLSHNEVETLFHEFGHALHSLLTQANYSRFSGTSVPSDFVEAPSQMLENWIWDQEVLDTFTADYRDDSKKIPADIIDRLKEARLATIGTFYRRQLSFGLLDLELHSVSDPNAIPDVLEVSERIIANIFLPSPEGTAFVANFGHLTGYDAGYYGYAWADAIAADMATIFEESPQRYFDTTIGRRLRDEIYAPGNSRDVNESIEKFLGRPRSLKPFLKSVGIDVEN
ncbi:MAG: Oligopeptidase A [Verrucomicrobia subdivision 3 bacterium]|nr:Oligopeptidase A [Limisphaerales bacterium]MCS1412871.1 Oligopeptidase A [Limisphaerales bacterium]